MGRPLLLALIGIGGFFVYGFYDAKQLRDITRQVDVRAEMGTWHLVNWDSGQFWGPNGIEHGNVFVQLNLSNNSDQIIRHVVLHGQLTKDDVVINTIEKRCQNKNSEYLDLPPHKQFGKDSVGNDNGMVCFVKLDYLFPSDPGASSFDEAFDAERERVWALVRSTRLKDWYITVEGTNPPMNAVVWLEDTWNAVTKTVVDTISAPFRRDSGRV
jgi:hypothetical protein